MSFDPNFALYTADPGTDGWETLETMRAEAEAELADRRRLYPSLVAKGRLARDVCDREIRVWASILAKLTPLRDRPATAPATWTEQVHTLRREIGLRRTLYPRWIAANRIGEVEAARKLAIVESMHDMWWNGDWSAEAVAAREETARRRAA